MNQMQICAACVGVSGVLLATALFAQAPRINQNQPAAAGQRVGEPARQTVLRPVQPAGATKASDEEIAALLLIDAQGEVKLGRFAESHASGDQAKQLARHLVEDHAKTVDTLQRLAGPLAATVLAPVAGKPTAPGGFNIVEAKQQIADQCATWMETELGRKSGTDFDRAFAGSQMSMHMHMICAEKVLRQYAGPELQKAINEDLQIAEEHFRMAQAIIEQPESAGPAIAIPKTNSAK